MASWRAKKNAISKLWIKGQWFGDPVKLKTDVRDYYKDYFMKKEHTDWKTEGLTFSPLSLNLREKLERDISKEEFLISLRECDGNKAPGPNSFNINFFKKN
ncbi:hypothetical protein QQ045_018141 [Rhodiola kirilowii]